jgi:hypothetical protein
MKYEAPRSRLKTVLGRVPALSRASHRLDEEWLNLKYSLYWNFLKNPSSRRRFQASAPKLDAVQRSIVEDLKSRGIAITSFEALLGDAARWARLSRSVDAFAGSERVRRGIENYRHALEEERKTAAGEGEVERTRTLYQYWVTLFPGDHTPLLPLEDEWLRLGIEPRVLDVVNSYFGLWSKLVYFDLWHTIPVGEHASRIGSQNWHRDPEDRMKLRLYLYFRDVAVDAGPLQYMPGSQLGGPNWTDFPWPGPLGSHLPPQEELEHRIPADRWVTCVGSRGTLVFCDTIGLHRGGVAAGSGRVLATWAFVTPASLYPRRFRVDWATQREPLGEAARFALI